MDDGFLFCSVPQNSIDNLVSDKYIPRWICCGTQRDSGWLETRLLNTCGKEGRWWEEKLIE